MSIAELIAQKRAGPDRRDIKARSVISPGSQKGKVKIQIIMILSSRRFTPGAAQAARSAIRRS